MANFQFLVSSSFLGLTCLDEVSTESGFFQFLRLVSIIASTSSSFFSRWPFHTVDSTGLISASRFNEEDSA